MKERLYRWKGRKDYTRGKTSGGKEGKTFAGEGRKDYCGVRKERLLRGKERKTVAGEGKNRKIFFFSKRTNLLFSVFQFSLFLKRFGYRMVQLKIGRFPSPIGIFIQFQFFPAEFL